MLILRYQQPDIINKRLHLRHLKSLKVVIFMSKSYTFRLQKHG